MKTALRASVAGCQDRRFLAVHGIERQALLRRLGRVVSI
jgi:hypothetical protein